VSDAVGILLTRIANEGAIPAGLLRRFAPTSRAAGKNCDG
jgi:antitoxin component of RelBE/YafQ-DinJ toxin-antitoxin module